MSKHGVAITTHLLHRLGNRTHRCRGQRSKASLCHTQRRLSTHARRELVQRHLEHGEELDVKRRWQQLFRNALLQGQLPNLCVIARILQNYLDQILERYYKHWREIRHLQLSKELLRCLRIHLRHRVEHIRTELGWAYVCAEVLIYPSNLRVCVNIGCVSGLPRGQSHNAVFIHGNPFRIGSLWLVGRAPGKDAKLTKIIA